MVFVFLSRGLNFDEETAKDLLMDVFVKIHLNINSYAEEKAALSTWIFNITKNVLIDHSGKQKNRNTLSLDSMFDKSSSDDDNKRAPIQIEDSSVSNDSNDLMIKEERNNSLANAMSLIKREEHRQILTLFYLEEKSYKEISEEMKVSLSMVKTLLYRAKNYLKVILDKKGFKL